MNVFALDAGTTETGFAIVDGSYRLLRFGKVYNEDLIPLLTYSVTAYDRPHVVLEGFKNYGNPMGESTIQAITWNGRFIQTAENSGLSWSYIYRFEEKKNLLHASTGTDAMIHRALIDRFAKHDFRSGKGTKNNPDWFYGMSKDAWTAYAIAVTFLDRSYSK